MPADRLPQNFDEFVAATRRVFDNDSFTKGLAFVPRPDDVIISPWNKSGTTWMQQIVQGLRSKGALDYDDVSAVIPWIEAAAALGQDLDAEQPWAPRAFKSHLSYIDVPKGARYIVSVRDPHRVFVSNFRFLEGWFFERGAVTINEYAPRWLERSRGQDYWTHLASWWARREDDNVLLLAFEHMKDDLTGTVRRVAEFLGVPLDQELLEVVVSQSSHDFMLANQDKFDDALVRAKAARSGALPADNATSKVTNGEFDRENYRIGDDILRTMDEEWSASMGTEFGLESYADVLAALR